MNANDILLWASTKRFGSWAAYKERVGERSSAEEDAGADDRGAYELPIYQRLRFNLERLGHVEFRRRDFPESWRVVPPTIAASSGERRGILCGARTDELVVGIQTAFKGVQITTQAECPDRIEIELKDDFERVAALMKVFVQRDATESLLAAIPSIADREWRTATELPFGNDGPVSRFMPETLEWVTSSAGDARGASLGLFRWQVPFDLHYYLKYKLVCYRVPVQVGKYILLWQKGRRVLSFNESLQSLAVPVSCRPPLLVDRALTLRTGLLPAIQQGSILYHNITESIAIVTAAILNQ